MALYKYILLSITLVMLGLDGRVALAHEPLGQVEAEKLFAERIAPLLKGRCLVCHGDGKALKGGLDLRTHASMLKGGESGEAIVPGHPEQSLIYRSIRYDDEIKMPPVERANERLIDQQVQQVYDWIAAGAPWPEKLKMDRVVANRKFDPINVGLPDYSLKPPDYQYKHGDIYIPAASADEPKLSEWSAEKASKYLDDGALAWSRQRRCVACHTTGAYMLTRPALTPFLGPPLAELKREFDSGSKLLNNPKITPVFHLYVAAPYAEWDANVTKQLSPVTDRALRLLCSTLSKEGAWTSHNPRWIPYILEPYHDFAVFAQAIGTAPGWLDKVKADGDTKTLDAVELLRKRLQTDEPRNDFDRVHLLWGDLRWPGIIDSSQRQVLVEMIGRHQRADGGWSLRSFGTPKSWGNGNRAAKLEAEEYGDDPPSDGHMTGLALVVLREAGVAVDDARIRNGVAWLKTNQRVSGRWWTRSLNTDFWQFSTYHSTAQALLALGMCGEIPRREP